MCIQYSYILVYIITNRKKIIVITNHLYEGKKIDLQQIVVYLNDPIHNQTSMSHLLQPFKI